MQIELPQRLNNTLKDVKVPLNHCTVIILLFFLRLAIKEIVSQAILVDAIYVDVFVIFEYCCNVC